MTLSLARRRTPHDTNRESTPDHQQALDQPSLDAGPRPPARFDGSSCRSRSPTGAGHPRGLWQGRAHRHHRRAVLRRRHPLSRDAIFRIASLTKPITAVATMSLVAEGLLRLDEPIDPPVPELA